MTTELGETPRQLVARWRALYEDYGYKTLKECADELEAVLEVSAAAAPATPPGSTTGNLSTMGIGPWAVPNPVSPPGETAARRDPGWQPIETAPKDRDVTVSDGNSVGSGEWCDCEGGHWIIYGGWPHTIDEPTHWMPLPSPPALSGAASQEPRLFTECCDVPILANSRFCQKCGWEARIKPSEAFPSGQATGADLSAV